MSRERFIEVDTAAPLAFFILAWSLFFGVPLVACGWWSLTVIRIVADSDNQCPAEVTP